MSRLAARRPSMAAVRRKCREKRVLGSGEEPFGIELVVL